MQLAPMRAARFRGQQQIEIVEGAIPEPGARELIIQVKANALCGSERGQFVNGARVTPGHEAAGVVVAAGVETTTAVGTPGVVYLMDYCGACRSCRHGFTNQCLDKRGDLGFNRDGGYASYELVPESTFFPVDADLPLDEATMLLDVMGTSSHAIRRAQVMRSDIESVLIAGAGPVGLGVLAMARLVLGPDMPVCISDLAPYRLKLAERLGGLSINLAEQSLADGLRQHGLGEVDLAFDSSGKSAARRASTDVLAKRGVMVCIGHGEELNLRVSQDVIAPERAFLGSEYFCFNELPGNLGRLHEHRAYLGQIITHRFPLDEIQQAFELFFGGETGKVLITP